MRFLKIFFFISVGFFFFLLFFHNIIEFDQDLGRHLKLGEIILKSGEVPKINLFSYTFPDFPFINSHWFSEVVFYLITEKLGLNGLLVFKTTVLTGAFLLTLITAYRLSKNLPAVSLAFAFFAPVLLERTEIRPEIFSYLFTSIFIFIIFEILSGEAKERNRYGWLWILPLLELLWVNSHIYFFLGPVLISVVYISSFWRFFREQAGFKNAYIRTKKILWPLVGVFLVTLLNPNGLAGALYPLRVFENYGYPIVENQNIFFLEKFIFNPNIFYFKIAVITFGLSFVFMDRKKVRLWTLLLSGLLILPMAAIRSFPFLFLIQLPLFAYNLSCLSPKVKEVLGQKFKLAGVSGGRLLVAMVIILTALRAERLLTNEYYNSIGGQKRFGSEIAAQGEEAVDFIVKNGLRGPIFNNFDIGGYLDYRLYPAEKVFIDNRPEAYPKAFAQDEYIQIQKFDDRFTQAIDQYNFRLIIFAHTDGTEWAQVFLSRMIKNPEFVLVHLDPYAAVWVKKSAYPKLSAEMPISEQNILDGKINPAAKKPNDYLSYAQVFSNFGWSGLTIPYLQMAYARNPDSASNIRALGVAYSQNRLTAQIGKTFLERYEKKTNLVLF